MTEEVKPTPVANQRPKLLSAEAEELMKRLEIINLETNILKAQIARDELKAKREAFKLRSKERKEEKPLF